MHNKMYKYSIHIHIICFSGSSGGDFCACLVSVGSDQMYDKFKCELKL